MQMVKKFLTRMEISRFMEVCYCTLCYPVARSCDICKHSSLYWWGAVSRTPTSQTVAPPLIN